MVKLDSTISSRYSHTKPTVSTASLLIPVRRSHIHMMAAGSDLSRKFWSAEISVRRTKITGKIGPPGPNFPGKIGPTLEIMVRV